jgi:uncharacterized damage-inducible protein DinB
MIRVTLPTILFLALKLQSGAAPAPAQAAPAQPQPARGQSQEILSFWNQVGHRLIVMAEDFPEDKYGFKPQKDQRSFGENFVHVADEDYRLMTAIKGSPAGPTGSKELKFEDYKTKAAVVALIKQVVADGEALLKEQGEAGINREVKYPYGNFMIHASAAWLDAIEHSAEHYGQLVVYYRVLGMVPPASRPKK